MKPLLRSCRAAKLEKAPSRFPSPAASVDESDSDTLYDPTPSPQSRSARIRLAKKCSQSTMIDRSPYLLREVKAESPTPSSFSLSSSLEGVSVKVKIEREAKRPKTARKRRSSCGGRKGEPRRCQNMVAQKKYRDKKVHASSLVSLPDEILKPY
jgi:hypothetical protein